MSERTLLFSYLSLSLGSLQIGIQEQPSGNPASENVLTCASLQPGLPQAAFSLQSVFTVKCVHSLWSSNSSCHSVPQTRHPLYPPGDLHHKGPPALFGMLFPPPSIFQIPTYMSPSFGKLRCLSKSSVCSCSFPLEHFPLFICMLFICEQTYKEI